MRRGHTFWVAASAVLIVADVVADQNGWPTWSSTCRQVFRTDTPAGRAAFGAAFGVFAVWFHDHMLNPATRETPS